MFLKFHLHFILIFALQSLDAAVCTVHCSPCQRVHVCPHLVGLTEEGIAGTALVDDVSDQVFLPVVGGEDADAVSRVAQQAHVHVQSHGVLRLRQVLHSNREKRRERLIFI